MGRKGISSRSDIRRAQEDMVQGSFRANATPQTWKIFLQPTIYIRNLRFPYVLQFIEEWNRGAIFVRMSVKVRKNCQKFDLYNLSKQNKSSTSAMDQNTPDRQGSGNRLASSQRFLINQLIQLKHWNWNTQSTPGVNSILANILLNPSKYLEPFFFAKHEQ